MLFPVLKKSNSASIMMKEYMSVTMTTSTFSHVKDYSIFTAHDEEIKF